MRCCSSCSSTTMRPMFGIVHDAGRFDAQPEVPARARGHPHAVVDTVTDDPDRRVGRHRGVGTGVTTGLAAPTRRNTRIDERVVHQLRAAAAERAESLTARAARTTAPAPTGRRRSPRTAGRRATPAGGACSIHASISTAPKLRPARAAAAPPRRAVAVRVVDAGAAAPPTRSTRSAARKLGRPPLAARDREHGLDRRRRRAAGRRATGARRGVATARRAARRASAASVGLVLGGERRRAGFVVLAQHSACRASTSTRSRRAPRSKRGNDLAAQPDPAVAQLVVHRVGNRSEAQARHRSRRSRPAGTRAAAAQNPAPTGGHSGQPGRGAAPQQCEQHGLGLVVAGVPDEDRDRADLVGDAFERGVPRVASAGFEVGPGVDLDRDDPGVGTQAGRRVADEARLAIGPGAQTVVDVHRDDVESLRAREREQRQRVGAPGACDRRRGHRERAARRRSPHDDRSASRRRPSPTSSNSSAVSRTPSRCTMRRSPA